MAKKIKGYTIKSISPEGVYFLVNHWEQHKAFWVEPEKFKESMFFKRAYDAKRSLTKLLKVMDDYRTDEFMLVEIYELDTGLEKPVIVAEVEPVEVRA